MATINLSKGQKISLSKAGIGLEKIIVGLGWDENKFDGHDFDLDASAFLLAENGKTRRDTDFIFYHNEKSACGSVEHTGDNRTGSGDGDDEQIIVDLQKVPADVARISFTVTIHDADARKQNFGQVNNAYVHILNEKTNEELIRYDLGEDYSIETAVVVCDLYKHEGEWKFNAIGSGYQGGLHALATAYGLDVE